MLEGIKKLNFKDMLYGYILVLTIWIFFGYILNRQRKKRIDNFNKFVIDTKKQVDKIERKLQIITSKDLKIGVTNI